MRHCTLLTMLGDCVSLIVDTCSDEDIFKYQIIELVLEVFSFVNFDILI